MTSQINPNNIDGAYPIAGQDNDSQGFRDNFTNTKTNFAYASAEITDLQSKVVLKAALTGTTLDNDMNNSVISNVQLLEASAPRIALGSVTSAALNFAAGPYYTLTTGGSVSLSFSNLPVAGQVATMRLQITVSNTAYSLVLPASVTVGVSNLQGFDATTNSIIFNRTGTYEYEFETSNGGTTISIFDLSQNHDPIYLPSSEDLAASAAVDLGVTTSYFSTAAAETATMAAGAEGQIKVLAMYADTGDMVITVTNAAWGGAGTITFSAVGQACTLQYINAKWFCIGNNGASFA